MPGYQKLLVVLDLSDDSEQVAVAARDLAAYSKALIVALHVVEFVPVEPMGESLMPTVHIEEELMRRSRTRLNELAARLGFEAAKLRVEAGNIKAEILRVADEEGADLIDVQRAFFEQAHLLDGNLPQGSVGRKGDGVAASQFAPVRRDVDTEQVSFGIGGVR